MKNLFLLGLVILLGVYTYFGILKPEKTESLAKEHQLSLLTETPENIIGFSYSSLLQKFKLEKFDNSWKVTEPYSDQADEVEVNQFISDAFMTPAKELVFSAGTEFEKKRFGLTTDGAPAVFELKSSDSIDKNSRFTIGTVQTQDDSKYVLTPDNRLLLMGSQWSIVWTKPPEEFRDKRIWRVEMPKVTGISLHYKMTKWQINFDKKAQLWASPSLSNKFLLSDKQVLEYLNKVLNLRMNKSVGAANDQKLVKSLGLNAPDLILQFEQENGHIFVMKLSLQKTNEIQLNREGDKIPDAAYVVTNEAPHIAKIFATSFDDLNIPLSKFIDKSLPFKFENRSQNFNRSEITEIQTTLTSSQRKSLQQKISEPQTILKFLKKLDGLEAEKLHPPTLSRKQPMEHGDDFEVKLQDQKGNTVWWAKSANVDPSSVELVTSTYEPGLIMNKKQWKDLIAVLSESSETSHASETLEKNEQPLPSE